MSQTTTAEKDKEWNLRIIPKKDEEQRVSNTKWRVLQAFHNVDFRYGHDGIFNVCKEKGIDLSKLERGNVVVFFNTAMNSIKIAFSHEDIFYHREPRKLDVRVLPKIMETLNSNGKISYPNALEAFITERLKCPKVDEEKIKKDTKLN